jgi:hypothetical protein
MRCPILGAQKLHQGCRRRSPLAPCNGIDIDRPGHIEAVDADPAQAVRAGRCLGQNANAKLGQLHEIVLAHHGVLSSEFEIALARKLGEGDGQFAIGASQQVARRADPPTAPDRGPRTDARQPR